ncbi:MAG: hypothetical protein JNK48_18145, partial [Bryobacterales bacterium]|nr:hypothetical protein [Bryobacterales bacterium]
MNEFPLPLLSIAVLSPLAGAILALRAASVRLARIVGLLAVAVGLAASLAALWLAVPQRASIADPWSVPLFGAPAPLLAADTLSCLGLSLIASLTLFTILVAPRRDLQPRQLVRLLLLLAGISAIYASNHLFVLVCGWALAAMLIAWAGRAGAAVRAVLTGGWLSLGGAVFLLSRDASARGAAAPFSLHELSKSPLAHPEWAFILLMAAVLLTKGVFPFHSWVVTAFDSGPIAAAGLLANAHLGAFLIAKVAIPVMPEMARKALPLLSDVALFTMCYMAVLALRERSPRRILALLQVGQASTILVGLESATEAGVTGALVHWMVVAVSATTLIAVLRLLEVRTGSRLDSTRFLGLANRFPRLAVFFLIAGLALVGLPGTLGFIA